jgi:hypothetical protein
MQPRRLLVCIALGVTLAGCASDGGLGRGKPDKSLQPAPPMPEAASVAAVLDLMRTLNQTDPARQAEAFQAAKDAADLAPTTSNLLRYGMALAAPGHSGSDAVAAQRQLSELLARPETLLPMERALALVQLKEVEQRLVLQAENRRLRDEVSRDTRDKLQAANRRLQSEQDENARLRKELEDLQAKLDAVTHIERSINDRKNGSRQP